MRTRLQPISGGGKSKYVVMMCLGLSLVGAVVAQSYGKGASVRIRGNAPGANIVFDNGNSVKTDSSGSAQAYGIPIGSRTVQILHRDFEPLSTAVRAAWLSSNDFSYTLKPIVLMLTINTLPGAEIMVDGGLKPKAGFCHEDGTDLWISQGEPTRALHIAFRVSSRAAVNAFHVAALAAGGQSNGEPGLRPQYHPNYYGAYVLDPDGHNLEAVCHDAPAAVGST